MGTHTHKSIDFLPADVGHEYIYVARKPTSFGYIDGGSGAY